MQDSLRPLHAAELAEIEQRCIEESKRYEKTGESDESYCLELVRHALQLTSPPGDLPPVWANELARDALVAIYRSVIEATMNRGAVLSREAREEVTQKVWLRFWHRASKGKLEFDSLGQFITYLQKATVRRVIDHVRKEIKDNQEVEISALIASASSASDEERADRIFGEQLKPLLSDGGNNPGSAYLLKRFGERCNELLDNSMETRIFTLYRLGYPPRESAKQLIAEGQHIKNRQPTSRLVSDVLEKIFKRLQEDEEIRDLLQSD